MKPSSRRPMLAAREPSRAFYEHAAGLLAAARALETGSRAPEATDALGPTLACVEATLQALAEATDHLRDHLVGNEAVRSLPRDPATDLDHAVRQLRASLEDSREACARARASARSAAPGSEQVGCARE